MTTLTVTATEGGATNNGILLRIYVLTGAAAVAAQTGGSVNTNFGSNVNAWTLSITTTSGSNVYGSASMSLSGNTPTGTAMTVVDTFSDTVNAQTYVTGKSLNVTSGATTRGFQASPAAAGPLALQEILASGTLAEDASAPGSQPFTATGATTVTSGSFTPPPGSLIVAVVSCDGGAGATTMSVTDNLATHLNWTQKANNGASGAYAGIFIADVPGGAPPQPPAQPGQTWLRRFHHRQALPVAAVTAVIQGPAGSVQPPQAKTHPRRYPARVVWDGFLSTTTNAVPPGAPSGQVQDPQTKTHPRRYPSRATWRGFVSSTVNASYGSVQELMTRQLPRRYPSRAVQRGFISSTTNAPPPLETFSAALSWRSRRTTVRAYWRGFISRTVNGSPANVPGQVQDPQTKTHPRRYPSRAVWKGFVSSTVNASYGSVQELQTKTPPRRYPARAVWRGFVSTTTNASYGSIQDLTTRQPPRRYPSRAVWHGFVSSTVNAAPAAINGSTQDLATRQPRRYPSRAVWHGTVSTTVNAAPANVPGQTQELATRQPPRRYPSRAVWHGVTARTVNASYGSQPGGLIRRRTAARAVVIGRPPRGAAFVAPPGTVPKNLVIKRRSPARAYIRWTPVRTVNAPPPVFLKGYATATVGEAASMQATVGEAASIQATIGEAASTQGSVS